MGLHAKLLQLCLTLSNRMDCSLSGSSVHGILQASILERVAISFSACMEKIKLDLWRGEEKQRDFRQGK